MRIYRHHLEGVTFRGSPNLGGRIRPELIVVHYTAGPSAASSIKTLCNPNPVPFNRAAWHAGTSQYNGRPRVNGFSAGIELDNPGFLKKTSEGWKTWFGQLWPADQVIEARHKHGGKLLGWATFPEVQLQALELVGKALIAAYPTIGVIVGHDDVAPGRKKDPGPAFPMERFKKLVG
jgi:N-acetylmuramoyl-L-alanine amidase